MAFSAPVEEGRDLSEDGGEVDACDDRRAHDVLVTGEAEVGLNFLFNLEGFPASLKV